jgi:hypothetical protein
VPGARRADLFYFDTFAALNVTALNGGASSCSGDGRRFLHLDAQLEQAQRAHCMNQPWLTTSDCPVSALLSKPAKNTAVSATS